jgi:hypothetical protein
MSANRIRLLFLAFLALSQSGCLVLAGSAAVGGGVAGVAYVKGKVAQSYDAPMTKTEAAVEASLRDLNLSAGKLRPGPTHSEIEGSTSLGETVIIDIDQEKGDAAKEGGRTKVSIRVGTFGDQTLSKRILDQVDKRLNSNEPLPPAGTGSSPFIPPTNTIKQAVHETSEPPLAN